MPLKPWLRRQSRGASAPAPDDGQIVREAEILWTAAGGSREKNLLLLTQKNDHIRLLLLNGVKSDPESWGVLGFLQDCMRLALCD